MQTVPLAKARAELSHLIDLACRGEEVVIARRGQVVAGLGGQSAKSALAVWAAASTTSSLASGETRCGNWRAVTKVTTLR